MELWKKLYGTVWLAFFSCVLIPRWMGVYAGWPVHAVLGIAMLILTQTNARRLAAISVPPRLKRISKIMAGLAAFQLVCGIAMGALAYWIPQLPVVGQVLYGFHVVCALAILAQSSSVATAYDMWEEKEFGTAS
jgi:hypothetical protein